MVVMLADEKLVNKVALIIIKSPVMLDGPSREISPDATEDIRTEPEIVEQLAYWVASALETIVAVA